MERPNPDLFQKHERPGEYDLVFRVVGEVRRRIKAETQQAAKEAAEEMTEVVNDDFCDLDEVFEVEAYDIRPAPTMYLIRRGGTDMRTSCLLPGDEPRGPTDSGF